MSGSKRRLPPSEVDLAVDAEETVRILEGFIRSEVQRAGLSRVVVGLSGGIDSTVATYLAARALGAASVHAVLLPYRLSDAASSQDARKVVGILGVNAETVDISAIVDGFVQAAGEVDRLRLGNVMARARMIVLYDRSAEYHALVLGTSNKTELLLGYGTLFGDLACAINPLGDLFKTQVRDVARHLGVPDSIRRKAPSADLWPGQEDEVELGISYEELDRLLALLVDARVSRETVLAAGHDVTLVDRVIQRIVRSQFKRRLPVIAKLSTRSVGWDFRYPRDWLT